MSLHMDYFFEDIELVVCGVEYLASGLIDVEYNIEPADPSVGIFSDSAEAYGFGTAEAELENAEGNTISMTILVGAGLHRQLVKGLDIDHVEEQCRAHFFDE